MDNMAPIHMTEAELARDLRSALAKVESGAEIVIERDHRPIAIIKTPKCLAACCQSASR